MHWEQDFFIGENARKLRGLLKLNHPMRHGVVTDWQDMTNVWRHMFHELAVSQEEVRIRSSLHPRSFHSVDVHCVSIFVCTTRQHPILITESPLNPRKNRGKTAEVFFETFNAPALYVAAPSILSLYVM